MLIEQAASKILVLDVSEQERKEVIVGSEGGRKTDKKGKRFLSVFVSERKTLCEDLFRSSLFCWHIV